jgi:hypothetical protein
LYASRWLIESSKKCKSRAQSKFGKPLCSDGCDPSFLRQCRKYKENLSLTDTPVPLSLLVSGMGRLKLQMKRTVFEGLIVKQVEHTVELTRSLWEDAVLTGQRTDAVILIGGSSRVPLVQRHLREALAIKPRRWQKQDLAVSLGAAYHADRMWGDKRGSGQKTPQPTPVINGPSDLNQRGVNIALAEGAAQFPAINGPADLYRRAIKRVWSHRAIEQQDLEELVLFAQQLGLSREEAGVIEIEVMGELKEAVFDRREAKRRSGGKMGSTPTPKSMCIHRARTRGRPYAAEIRPLKTDSDEDYFDLVLDHHPDIDSGNAPTPTEAHIIPTRPEVNRTTAVHPLNACLIYIVIGLTILGIMALLAVPHPVAKVVAICVGNLLWVWYLTNWKKWRKQRRQASQE